MYVWYFHLIWYYPWVLAEKAAKVRKSGNVFHPWNDLSKSDVDKSSSETLLYFWLPFVYPTFLTMSVTGNTV